MLEDFRNIIDNEFQSTSMALPSATNILQPQDRHMISKNYLVESSPDFAPKAEQFYYGKQLLDKCVPLHIRRDAQQRDFFCSGTRTYQRYFLVASILSTGMSQDEEWELTTMAVKWKERFFWRFPGRRLV